MTEIIILAARILTFVVLSVLVVANTVICVVNATSMFETDDRAAVYKHFRRMMASLIAGVVLLSALVTLFF